MKELKELIETDAMKRVSQDTAHALLEDLRFSLEYDAEVSASLNIAPRSPRQILRLLIEADQKKAERRYGKTNTVEWAMMQIEKIAPDYVKSIKRSYGKAEEGEDTNN